MRGDWDENMLVNGNIKHHPVERVNRLSDVA